MKTLTIDGIKYSPMEESDVKIAILQRGWVFVGNAKQDGEYITLHNAQCIRNWGTTRGLGELAENGPTESTKLDPHGTVKFHILTSVALIDCDKPKWQKILS